MEINLVERMPGFGIVQAHEVESYLNSNLTLVGTPYNHHAAGFDGYTTQTLMAHYMKDRCSVYQLRTVEYTLDGREHTELSHILFFSGVGSQEIKEGLLARLE
ncbi:hypothetical protein H6504_05735 [Candidatus Woesearchaeota archaeon]|nr:hypothetical protein [Candidatus Woesearchaeota archaeon]